MDLKIVGRSVAVVGLVALAACSSGTSGGGGTGTGGGGTGTGGTGGTGGTVGTGGTGGTATTTVNTANTVHRKYALDVFSNPGSVSYFVGDRNSSGGFETEINQEPQTGTADRAFSRPTGGSVNLEGGDNFTGLGFNAQVSDTTTNGVRNRNYSSTTFLGNETLSVVESDHVTSGVYTSFRNNTQEMNTGMFYGARNPATVNNAPSANAQYTGTAGARLVAIAGVTELTCDLTLNANIGTGSVSGNITNIQQTFQNGSQSGATYQINLNSGTISGNTYAGNAAVVDTATGASVINTTGANGRGEYSGGFFGTTGQATAGMIDITGTGIDPQSGNSGRIDIFGIFVGE